MGEMRHVRLRKHPANKQQRTQLHKEEEQEEEEEKEVDQKKRE
jgi:hypothetical protein